jgi:acyl-CoA-binding protein
MKFSEAVELVRTGNFSVTNDEKLRLYVCYKVATCGVRPDGAAPLNPQKRIAWNAWNENTLTADEAKRAYVELVLQVMS